MRTEQKIPFTKKYKILKKPAAVILAAILLITSISVLATTVWAEQTATDTEAAANTEAEEAINTEPQIKAQSAIIYCKNTGEVIWSKNPDEKLAPASMTKLLTALLAAENLDLDQEVEIPEGISSIEPSKIYLQTGEKITVKDLIYGALLPSGNDAATALAVATAGTVEDFVVMMNDRATKLGCKNTNFVNASGLDAENQYTTARDMALIAAEALANEDVREIAGTDTYTISETNAYQERILENTNLFLSGGEATYGDLKLAVEAYDGVFGGKTGTLSKDYCTMVTGLDYYGAEIYSVVLSTDFAGKYEDIKLLMDYGKENISISEVFEAGTAFGYVRLKGGATNKVEAIAAEAGIICLPEGASSSLISTKCVYSNDLVAPIKAGQTVGKVEIYVADDLYRTIDLVAASDIDEGWLLSPLGITNVQTIVICLVLIFILILGFVILIARASNKRKIKKLRQAKIREEALRRIEREEDLKRRNWPY
jgi:D-alanyl-D-alanine carboxypeptidase (penicillin-binding protein 5/6)